MKTLNFKLTNDVLVKFALSNQEMINVRGGSDTIDPTILPTTPPIKI